MEGPIRQYLCPYCGTKFHEFDDLKRHALSVHVGKPAPSPEGMIQLTINGNSTGFRYSPNGR